MMLVQSFSPEVRWRDDFQAFASALGAPKDTGKPLEVPRHDSPSLFLVWCKGDPRHRDVDLRAAVQQLVWAQ